MHNESRGFLMQKGITTDEDIRRVAKEAGDRAVEAIGDERVRQIAEGLVWFHWLVLNWSGPDRDDAAKLASVMSAVGHGLGQAMTVHGERGKTTAAIMAGLMLDAYKEGMAERRLFLASQKDSPDTKALDALESSLDTKTTEARDVLQQFTMGGKPAGGDA